MTAPTMTVSELQARIDRGMEWLDAVMPGWVDLIEVDRLDISSPCNCLLGQTFGGFDLHVAGLDMDQAAAFGFDAASSHDGMGDEYAALSELWKTAVRKRRAEVAGHA